MNADGIINIIDIIALVNIIIDNSIPTDSDLCNGDLNQDQIINIQDIIALINIIFEN